MKHHLVPIITTILLLSGCEQVSVMTTPKKSPVKSHTALATQAEKQFWDTLHQGDYHQIATTTKLLTAAYLENPNDPQLAAHLGFTHIWKITERERDHAIANNPTIVDEIVLSKKYFSDAVELDPTDARFLGFLADSTLIEGQIFHDEREQVRGYFQLTHAISQWPEFNYFTGGYIMSTLPPTDKRFQEGLAWQWKTLDLCAGKSVDRNNPDFSPYLARETQQGPQRACWNSWIAPHNFEGFFLNMGDMLVKNGDWKTAVIIYNNAKLSKTYANWPSRHLLEKHLKNAKTNITLFNESVKHDLQNSTILFNSGYGCVVCHQTKGA